MWSTVVLTAALLTLAAGCLKYEENYYAELGCRPKHAGENGCPKSYDCSMLSKRSPRKCYYRGKEYIARDTIQQDNPCLDCLCRAGDPRNFTSSVSIDCAQVECGERVHRNPPEPGCYRVYEHGKCCSTKQVCLSGQTPRPVCQYKGKEYQVGEMFYPYKEPNFECICQRGFDGSLIEPYCRKKSCGLEINYVNKIAKGCIPVYLGNKVTCPVGWRCPEKSDKVFSVTNTKNSDLQCQFGELKMEVGDKLSPSANWGDADCECRVPPHPVCLQKN